MPSAANPTTRVPLPQPVPSKPAERQDDVLLSSTLLGTRQAIEIEHNGQRYRLQSTKSGKLILTK